MIITYLPRYLLLSCSSIGWRLGLQAVTGLISILFVLGTFYRSASLYHPQRRAILHLKSQKRKIKNKDKANQAAEDTTPPLFDFTTLKSRTVQILLASTAVAALGLNTPLLYMVMITFDQRFVKIFLTACSYCGHHFCVKNGVKCPEEFFWYSLAPETNREWFS